jgi:hypothetical protein
MLQPKFDLGKITVSTEALCALLVSGQDADFFLQKHASGDWGVCDPATQERGLREGSEVLSRYRTLRGKEIIVSTFLAKLETSVYCEWIVDVVGINHGFTYDTGPHLPTENAAPPINTGFEYDGDPGFKFKYDGNSGQVSATGGIGYPLYDLPGLVAPTIDPGQAAAKEADSVNPGYKYDGNFGPVSNWDETGYPHYDLPGLVAPTHDVGPAVPKEADSVSPESAFKYDAIQPVYDPFPSPIHKASPYYTGPTEPKKADPAKPKEEQP